MERLLDLGKRTIAQNDRNKILLALVKKKFKNFVLKNSKNQFFGPRYDKKIENLKIFQKGLLIENDSEWSKTYFKMKISILKNLPLWLSRGQPFFRKMGVIG